MNDCEHDFIVLAIGLSLLVILFMGSTIYFAYWANRLRDMLLRECDEQEGKNV
jgi:hypothetical protein